MWVSWTRFSFFTDHGVVKRCWAISGIKWSVVMFRRLSLPSLSGKMCCRVTQYLQNTYRRCQSQAVHVKRTYEYGKPCPSSANIKPVYTNLWLLYCLWNARSYLSEASCTKMAKQSKGVFEITLGFMTDLVHDHWRQRGGRDKKQNDPPPLSLCPNAT